MTTDDHFRAWLASRDPADLGTVFDRTAPHLLLVAMWLEWDQYPDDGWPFADRTSVITTASLEVVEW